jgi:hypothetical protein
MGREYCLSAYLHASQSPLLILCRFYAGFEFAKREYRRRFAVGSAEKIPVWALLTSGSIGGVSDSRSFGPPERQLMLSIRRFHTGWLATRSML